MKTKMKNIVLVTSALIALSGCLDDPFDYSASASGNSGTQPEGGAVTQLYGEGSTGAFVMQAIDTNDITVDVDGLANSALSNIQVTGDYANQTALNVKVAGGEKASLQLVSGSAVDLSEAYTDGKGTLIFDVKVNEFPTITTDTPNKVTVSLLSEGATEEASVDITNSISAYLAAGSIQSVRLPLTCFTEKGIDISKSTKPFSVKVSSDINYDISNIRFQAESGGDTPGTNYVIDCNNPEKRELLTGAESIVNKFDGTDLSGWGAYSALNGDKVGHEINGSYFLGVHAKPKKETQNSGITFLAPGLTADQEDLVNNNELAITDESIPKLKDLSQYIAHGHIQFDLYVESDSETPHPTGNLMVRFETPMPKDLRGPAPGDYRYTLPSEVIAYNITGKTLGNDTVVPVKLPLKDFFTNEEGMIDINALQNITKVQIIPEKILKSSEHYGYKPTGMIYYAANVKLTMN